MRLVITGIVAALMMMQQSAVAAPDDYEIDLKELRRITPPRPVKPEQQKHTRHPAAEQATGKAAETGDMSIYVVQPGDNLFLILMKKYGLTDPEAEQLIPNVMQLNGISSPKGLKVGQRLRIPLSAGERTSGGAPSGSVPPHHAPPPAAETATTSDPARAQVTTQASPPQPVEHPPAEIISIISESPCKLARNLVKKWGLPAVSTVAVKGAETVDAAYAGQSVTVICGLSEAEQYTYERLLAINGARLLFFDQDESADYVVEELADSLGLAFQKRDADRTALPLTYVFPPFGSRTQELQLTIFPSAQPE